VTSHHTRSALGRAIMGSFSESLSLIAKSPLLVVPPGARAIEAGKNEILYPTDFSEASLGAFDGVVRLAKRFGSKIAIFHKLQGLSSYALEFGAPAPEVMRGLVSDAESGLAQMKERATRNGVTARTVLDRNFGHVGQSIVTEAAKGYGLVAVVAHSGFWDRVVMGSASRFVLRECPTAVWVFRPSREVSRSTRRTSRALAAQDLAAHA
jgi:nucleotide-binding universal stress UspA family protein